MSTRPPPTHTRTLVADNSTYSVVQWARTRTLPQHQHRIVTPSSLCRMSDTWPTVSTQYLHCIYAVSTHSMTDPAARLPFLIFSPVPVSGGQVLGWWDGPGGAGATIGCHQGSLWARSHCGGWAGHWAAGRPMLAPCLTVSSPGGGLALTNCASSCHLCATRAPHCACAVLTRASRNSAGWLRR